MNYDRFKSTAEITAETDEFDGRYAFIAPNDTPVYTSASDEQIELYAFIVDETTLLFPDGTGPYGIF